MKRTTAVVVLLLAGVAASCSPPGSNKPSATATAASNFKANKPGGIRKLFEPIKTDAASVINVLGWRAGAPKRSESNGPGQSYETVEIAFCAGPQIQISGSDLTVLFSLELPGGDRVAPDSATGPTELRSKKSIAPGECVKAPIVFQVGGGRKPAFVVFESDPLTKWTVP